MTKVNLNLINYYQIKLLLHELKSVHKLDNLLLLSIRDEYQALSKPMLKVNENIMI